MWVKYGLCCGSYAIKDSPDADAAHSPVPSIRRIASCCLAMQARFDVQNAVIYVIFVAVSVFVDAATTKVVTRVARSNEMNTS